MNKFKLVILLGIWVLGLTSIHAQEQSTVAITLERTACFGTCPVYTITLLENGDVMYNGQNFVEVTGEQKSEIDPETVTLMVNALEKAGYFDWDETYDTQTVTDLPSVISSVTHNGETHRIVHYAGDNTAPLALSFLEHWIDEMTNSQLWTGVKPDISWISNGMDTPLITIQRGACFGACPIYNVAFFENGTIVYTGIANVKSIGVTIFETDPSTLTSITQQAKALGYFDWQDSYEERVMTDQATVISSIRSEDQFKRISRYDGDPNAPVGLLWVEASIDQLMTTVAG